MRERVREKGRREIESGEGERETEKVFDGEREIGEEEIALVLESLNK